MYSIGQKKASATVQKMSDFLKICGAVINRYIPSISFLNDWQYPWEDWEKVEKGLFTIIKSVLRIKVYLNFDVFDFLSILM